jgi:KipI family sensor histidine kinase inhibitor
MMGFTPGYPYMGKLDDVLIMPRLETPRTRVPAGTVAIAGSQTGIYSIESPGGWNLIGWTPLKLFDPKSESPFLFSPGDEVKFVAEK